jgi:hypothetical protein
MTIKQGNEINALYLGYNKTIDSLKIKSKNYDSAINQISKKQDSLNLYRYHINNIKGVGAIDEEFKEKWQRTQELNRMYFFVLFFALALIKSQ